MQKLWKIVGIFLLSVFVDSPVSIDFSLISEIVTSEIQFSVNECSSESLSREQNEESNEGSNDIEFVNRYKHIRILEKGYVSSYISSSKIDKFPESYSPPPEFIIISI